MEDEWKRIASRGPNFNPPAPRVGQTVRVKPKSMLIPSSIAHHHACEHEGEIIEIVESNYSHGYGDDRGWKLKVEWEDGDTKVVGSWWLERKL